MNVLQRKNIWYSVFLICTVALVYVYRNNQPQSTSFHIQGTTMGVVPYNVKYYDTEGRKFDAEIAKLLNLFNQALSTYIPSSEISRFNQADTLIYESPFFYPVLKKSQEVWEKSGGAFDPTIMPLVRTWGFGPGKERELPNKEVVDSLLKLVGFEGIRFDNTMVWKADKDMQLDFSAIAKGYAVDVVADLLKNNGVNNFMVEIGGEVRCAGTKPSEEPWLIGIENPISAEAGLREATVKVKLLDKALATSGNYRNFYIKDGKKYAHTLSPISGYPVEHSLLGASVFASDCMTADAFATAFMVVGLEESKRLLTENPEVEAVLIYDEKGELKTFVSDGMAEFMVQ